MLQKSIDNSVANNAKHKQNMCVKWATNDDMHSITINCRTWWMMDGVISLVHISFHARIKIVHQIRSNISWIITPWNFPIDYNIMAGFIHLILGSWSEFFLSFLARKRGFLLNNNNLSAAWELENSSNTSGCLSMYPNHHRLCHPWIIYYFPISNVQRTH